MPGITGQGTTFNLPNFVGELFSITPADTPLLAAIGGLTGGEQVLAKDFQFQAYDLRTPGQNTALEGANAPTPQERTRWTFDNVVEIHQEAVEISYTKQAATAQLGGLNIGGGSNPVTDELGWQVEQRLKEVARDIEYSFIQGVFQRPVDNTTDRQTRGLLAHLENLPSPEMDDYSANVLDAAGGPLTEELILDLLQMVWDNGGIRESETATLILGSSQKRVATQIFVTDKGYVEATRNVGGVNLQTIETDFGRLNIMLNRYMPADTVAVASLDELAPVFLLIPGKGFLFVEPLAKVGAAERRQIYGEVGLKAGNPLAHGKIENLEVLVPGS